MSFQLKTKHIESPADPNLQRRAVLHSFRKEERTQVLQAYTNSFTSLPLYKTPPSARKNEKPFNPFNRNLMERLESSTFSPNVFKEVISPGEVSSREFRWTIEDVSRFKPAKIDESSVDHEIDLIDIETEQSAQEAIERYFSKVEIPSPWEAPKHCSSPLAETPVLKIRVNSNSGDSSSATNFNNNGHRSHGPNSSSSSSFSSTQCRTASTQTCWSFPPVLPEEVELLLKPYLQPVSNECEIEEENLSTSTLRRKLNFNKVHNTSERDVSDDEIMSCDRFSLDPGFCSPISRFQAATPLPMTMLSPPDVSPIISSVNTTQSKLTTRLNFTSSHHDNINVFERQEGEIHPIKVTELRSDYNTNDILKRKAINESFTDDNEDEFKVVNFDPVENNHQAEDIESVSQDTGYQTQNSNSNDKMSWVVNNDEVMDMTTDNASWAENNLQASSTPTKSKSSDMVF